MSAYEKLKQITEQVKGPDTEWSQGDTVERVSSETQHVFESFAEELSDETENRNDEDLSPHFEIIANAYGESLYSFESFKEIAEKIFKDGVNWGRIVGVFSFGYWLLEWKIKKKASEKMSPLMLDIAEKITKYIREAAPHIAEWIAKKGGWRMAMNVVYQQIPRSIQIGIAVGVVTGAISGVAAFMIAQKYTH